MRPFGSRPVVAPLEQVQRKRGCAKTSFELQSPKWNLAGLQENLVLIYPYGLVCS